MLSFTHVYQAPTVLGAPTLLMLHGTGGNEHDLVPLAADLMPGAGVLSPRGKVLENGMPRFFRRFAEGVFDLDDLRQRTLELAAFVKEASGHYKFDSARVVAVGFSNGANIAGSTLLLVPGLLAGAVLLRAMVPHRSRPAAGDSGESGAHRERSCRSARAGRRNGSPCRVVAICGCGSDAPMASGRTSARP